MNSKIRVNRPETAAKVLAELSKQARNISMLFFVFTSALSVVALYQYGATVAAMGMMVSGAMACMVYLLAIRVLVLSWHEVQFYRPTPRTKMRKVPFYTRRGVQDLEVVDRVGG